MKKKQRNERKLTFFRCSTNVFCLSPRPIMVATSSCFRSIRDFFLSFRAFSWTKQKKLGEVKRKICRDHFELLRTTTINNSLCTFWHQPWLVTKSLISKWFEKGISITAHLSFICFAERSFSSDLMTSLISQPNLTTFKALKMPELPSSRLQI